MTAVQYRVTYAIDSLDPSPLVKLFDSEWEAQEFLSEEINSRMDYLVQHSVYSISESEYESMYELESSLARIERA